MKLDRHTSLLSTVYEVVPLQSNETSSMKSILESLSVYSYVGCVPKRLAANTWIAAHSAGTSTGERHFDMFINERHALTFTTRARQWPSYWTFGGADSTRIVFEFKTKDGAQDAHGMAYLRVPLSAYPAGQALKIKVVGREQQSNDWYMTFKYSFTEKIDAKALPFVLNDGKQPIRFTVLHFGKPDSVKLHVNNRISASYPVVNGFNVFDIPIPTTAVPVAIPFTASIGSVLSADSVVVQRPVVNREIGLIHHSHTDIGYSHIQEEVIGIHSNNIRRSMELVDRTKHYPQGSRYIWNIESAWAVENFFDSSTEQERQRFIDQVKNGSIVIAGTYANVLTGLALPEEQHWNYEYASKLRDSLGLPIKTGMMSDIPGMSWSTVDAMVKNGIRYFSNAPNYIGTPPYMGDRIGTTLMKQGNKAFWWKTTSGKDSVLFWTCGKGYSSWHGVPEGGINERGEDKIADYMDELDSIQYPYSMVQWRYNIVADNAGTDSSVADYVRNWNEKYQRPKLSLANVTEFFERFEKKYGDQVPVLLGEFSPYWEDGAYSTAKEEANARMASARIIQLVKLAEQQKIPLDPALLYRAKRGIVMFHEHTWGAFNSVGEPDNPFVIHQWNYKKAFLDSALYFTGILDDQLRKQLAVAGRIVVYNTTGISRSGVAEARKPDGWKGNVLKDERGKNIVVQSLSSDNICFSATDIPANGYRMYRFSSRKRTASTVENKLAFSFDSTTGSISKLRIMDKDWVDGKTFKGLLQALYVKGLTPNYAVSCATALETMDDGPWKKIFKAKATLDGTSGVVYELSHTTGSDMVQLSVTIDKKPVRKKEATHIAFPFSIPNPEVKFGVGSSYYTPEKFTLPGSNKDFYSVQRWLDISNSEGGVTIVSPQGALWEVGRLINEEKTENGFKKWETEGRSSSDVFCYFMNNYWHTNYKADQEGRVRFDFYLQFHGPFDLKKANELSYLVTEPLLVVEGR